MFAHKFNLKIVEIILPLISLMAIAIEAKICEQITQTETLVKQNGRMVTVPMNYTVKVCCEGYRPHAEYPWKCVSICTEGYVYDNEKGCSPRCDECENGTCMAPNECQCEDDHIEVKGGCAPKCDMECKNGFCIRPGECGCNEGYYQIGDSIDCVPICENCENGFCEKPFECQCKPGYKWNVREFKCRPKCRKNCVNGYCLASDICSCLKGYHHSSLESHVCIPDVNAKYETSEEEVQEIPTSELPEIEGIFRYFGKRIHFVGHVDGVAEEDINH